MPYVKPGVYISQKYVASGVGRSEFIVPVVIGVGLSDKRIWSEAMVRGRVRETVIVNPITRRFTLTYQSDMKYQNSRLYRNGRDLGNVSFVYINATTVEIKSEYYISGATYEFEYVAVGKMDDATAYAIKKLLYVAGTPDGSRVYRQGIDYRLDANGHIDWSIVTPASVTGTNTEPFNLSTNNRIKIGIDGKIPIEIAITGVDSNNVTASEVVTAINSALSADPNYGGSYGNVASVDGGKVKLTSVLIGESGRINFYVPSANDATNVIFGITPPAVYYGSGVRPAPGAVYYVRYDTTRPDDEYEKVRLFGGYSEALTELGPMNVQNDLLIGVALAFENGAPVVGVVQVKDDDGDGVYLLSDWMRAIDAVTKSSYVTDVCVLSTDKEVMAYAVRVIEEEASQLKNHWMGGWFGVAKGTVDGDRDTVDTAIWIATNLLQVPAQSQGRGRYVLVSTPVSAGVRRLIEDTDTRTDVEVELDTTFLACAVMGRQAGLVPISDTLLRKQIVGFLAESVSDNEVSASRLAANGVFCVVYKGGRLICFDPVTTDVSGEEQFAEPSIRVQKDYLAYRIRKRLDDLIVGVVPDDLDSFIYEVKTQIALEIEAAIFDKIIGAYTDDSGRPRAIDMFNDIKVVRDPTRKTEFRFMYWFNGRYGVKRLFGEYVVDVALK
jgi:hypothetical protein